MPRSRDDAARAPDLALPARAYIDMALSFANQGADTSAQDAEALAWRPFGIDYVRRGPSSRAERLHRARATVRQALRHIAEGSNLPPKAASKISDSVREAAARLDYTRRHGLRTVYTAHGIEIGAALGVALLEDSELAVRLRQCSQCEAFFIAEGRRTAAQYCSQKCASEAAREKGVARQRRYKQRKTQRGK